MACPPRTRALRPGTGRTHRAVRPEPQVAPLGVPEPGIDPVHPVGLGDRQPRAAPLGGVQAVPGVAGQRERLGGRAASPTLTGTAISSERKAIRLSVNRPLRQGTKPGSRGSPGGCGRPHRRGR